MPKFTYVKQAQIKNFPELTQTQQHGTTQHTNGTERNETLRRQHKFKAYFSGELRFDLHQHTAHTARTRTRTHLSSRERKYCCLLFRRHEHTSNCLCCHCLCWPHLLRAPGLGLFRVVLLLLVLCVCLPCCPSGQHHVQLATERADSIRAATTLRIRNTATSRLPYFRTNLLRLRGKIVRAHRREKREKPAKEKQGTESPKKQKTESSKWLVARPKQNNRHGS